ICCPAGSPVRSTRAVKSLSARAAGPTTRDASRNESVVAHSTSSRAGRSVRLHTIARSLMTSPLWTPYGTAGRILSEVTTAGAVVCAHTGRRTSEVVATPPTARADCLRNLRRFMGALLGFCANVPRPDWPRRRERSGGRVGSAASPGAVSSRSPSARGAPRRARRLNSQARLGRRGPSPATACGAHFREEGCGDRAVVHDARNLVLVAELAVLAHPSVEGPERQLEELRRHHPHVESPLRPVVGVERGQCLVELADEGIPIAGRDAELDQPIVAAPRVAG